MTPKEVLKFAKEQKAVCVDLKFLDFLGTWQHFTIPMSELSEGLFDEGSGFAVWRNRCQDRPTRGEVFEELRRDHPTPTPACVRNEQEQRFRAALKLERTASRHVTEQLDPVRESQIRGISAVGAISKTILPDSIFSMSRMSFISRTRRSLLL